MTLAPRRAVFLDGERRSDYEGRHDARPSAAFPRRMAMSPIFGLVSRFAGTLLFAGQLVSSSWAQDKAEPRAPRPPYPSGSQITLQWDYSCPSGRACSFSCPGTGGASSVTKLTIYLGTIVVGRTENAPALFYDFSTRDIPRANGFSISTGISTLSCQANGMVLDYSGPPQQLTK